MNKNLCKVGLAVTMVMGMQATQFASIKANDSSITVAASTVLPDGEYVVPTTLMNAANIANASMAGGALADSGKLVVKDGKWYLIAQFKTLDFGGMGSVFGNASQIKYYSDFTAKTAVDAEIVSMRNDATITGASGILENQEAVKEVKIPVEVNANGIYISMFVDFMNYAPDAYISFSTQDTMMQALQSKIDEAKTYKETSYSATSFALLKVAITKAEATLNGSDEEIAAQISALQTAINALATSYQLANGTYGVDVDVLKADSDTQSMAASAVKSATIKAVDGKLNAILAIDKVSAYGQTLGIDRIEYETADGSYVDAQITKTDEEGNVAEVQFVLPSNTNITNIKFYYGGSTRGAAARLSLALDKATKVSTSKFESDGTYSINFKLWNASSDQASMAASAFDDKAVIVVNDGEAIVYVTSKKMSMGTITAYLQTMKIVDDNNVEATIVEKDANGNPKKFSFKLPHEEEYINVLVNPMVAMMGNQDIAARIKMDYTTLTKVSDSTQAPDNETDGVDNDATTGNDNNSNTGVNNGTTSSTPNATTSTNTNTGVATKDTTNTTLLGGLLMTSFVAILYSIKKRLCK